MPESYKIRVKPVTTPPKTPSKSQARDTFETPNYAVDLLIPYIPKGITRIWECAAGSGRIAQRLYENGFTIVTSDIRQNRTNRNHIKNFLLGYPPYPVEQWRYANKKFCIVTNPPFSIKAEFIEKAFEYEVPFAFLINADYSGQSIEWVKRGCEKIIPTRRIAYITPNIVERVNTGEETSFTDPHQIPNKLLYKYSSSQFHSMWLTYGFGLGKTETFVDLPIKELKENIQ